MRRDGEDDHEQMRTLLGIYALGQMSPDEIAAVEAHLARCRPCLAECEELGLTALCLGALSDVDLTAAVVEAGRCMITIRLLTSGTGARTRPRPAPPGAAAGQ